MCPKRSLTQSASHATHGQARTLLETRFAVNCRLPTGSGVEPKNSSVRVCVLTKECCPRADKDVNPANPSVLGVTRFLAEKQLAAQAAAAAAATAAEAIEEEEDDDFSYQ